MAALDFPTPTANGQVFNADTGVIYTYVGTPPNGYWSGFKPDSGTSAFDTRYLKQNDQGTKQTVAGGGGLDIAGYIDLDGTTGKVTSESTVAGDPAGTLTTKDYVDGQTGLYVAKAGDTMTGSLALNDKITLNATDGNASFAGDVGIGTSSPAQALEVNGNIQVGNTASSAARIDFGSASTRIQHDGADNLSVYSNGSERARIDSAGRLLVGTSSARTNFYNSTTSSTQLQIEGTDYQNSSQALICNSPTLNQVPILSFAKSADNTVGSNGLTGSGHKVGELQFMGNDGAEFVQAAMIHAEVDGTSGSNDMPGRLIFSTTADGASTPTERMRINNRGQVITSSTFKIGPSSQFSIAGAQGALNNANNFSLVAENGWWVGIRSGSSGGVHLTTNATSWTSSSDEKKKTDLIEIVNGLQKVSSLRPVTGRYKTDPEGTSRSFLIAQDVLSVLPEAVETSDPDSLGLRYTEVIPLLVAALKESKERIEQLEVKVAAIEASQPYSLQKMLDHLK